MEKKMKKGFNYIWDIIELPVFIIVGYSLLDLVLQISTYINKLFPSWIFSVALTIFAFGLIGYKTIQEKEKPDQAAKYGAYAGLITGFVGAIIGIITFYFFPGRLAETIQQAAQAGADTAMIQSVMKIMIYVNLVLAPAFNAGIGALIAWIGGLVFKKK